MTTTTKLGDSLGRALQNDLPGTSSATDFLGRAVTASNKDFRGVLLVDTPNYPPPVWLASTAYTAGTRRRIPGTNETQTITVSGAPDNTSTYKLNVTNRGSTVKTAAIATNATGAQITTALVALSNVEPGDIVVTGSSTPYTATFQSELGNVALLEVTDKDFDGGTDPDVVAAAVTQGAVLEQILECTVAGTSAGSKPTAPAIGDTVTDNTVTWVRLK